MGLGESKHCAEELHFTAGFVWDSCACGNVPQTMCYSLMSQGNHVGTQDPRPIRLQIHSRWLATEVVITPGRCA